MLEIAQLLESALANNRSGLRKAAMHSVSRMAPEMTLRELLDSDPGEAIRELTLIEFGEALLPMTHPVDRRRVHSPVADIEDGSIVAESDTPSGVDQSSEERTYRMILNTLAEGPKTIGQLGKAVEIDTAELRGYLSWMKRMGKVVSSGRARATRYTLP